MAMDSPLTVAQTLTATYTMLWDDRRYDEWIDLFSDDANFDWRNRIANGRDAIQRMIGSGNTARPPGPGTHLTTNVVAVSTGDAVRASADFAFLGLRDGRYECLYAGRTYDVYREHVDHGWQFASRAVRFLGDDPPRDWPAPWSALRQTPMPRR